MNRQVFVSAAAALSLLAAPAVARASFSASVTPTSLANGEVTVSLSITAPDQDACLTGGSYEVCDWFASVTQDHPTRTCDPARRLFWVSSTSQDGMVPRDSTGAFSAAGTYNTSLTFTPFFPRQTKLCVFAEGVSNTGGEQLVAEFPIDLPSGYGMQYSTAYNCSNFGSRGDAQDYLYLYPSDPSRLDADHDGLACEDLPGTIYPAIPAEPTPPPTISTPVTTTTPITPTPVIPTKPPVTKLPKPATKPKTNPPSLPTLSQTKANSYLRTALQRRFGSLFWKGSFQPRCKRTSRTAFLCRPGWYQGDFSFAGRARIWLAVRGHAVTWNYSWRIQRLNTYCSQVQHRHNCTRIYDRVE